MQAKNRKFYEDFASRIRFLREKRGLTLAELSGGSPSTAKSWENGITPRTEQWEAIAERLGLSVSLVFLGHPKSREDYAFVAKFADELGVSTDLLQEQEIRYGALSGSTSLAMEPTAQQCMHYLAAFLAEAAVVPGGIGHTWLELQKYFPLDKFDLVTGDQENDAVHRAKEEGRRRAFAAIGDQINPPSAEYPVPVRKQK